MTTAPCGFRSIPGGPSGQDMLVVRGPTILVDIGFDPAHDPNSNAPPVSMVQGVGALIDTGATESHIDNALAVKLGLNVIDRRKIAGSAGQHEVSVYLAQIYVPSLDFTVYGAFAGVDLAAGGQYHQALLGRTFLQGFTLTYVGTTGAVTIEQKPIVAPLPGLGGGPWRA